MELISREQAIDAIRDMQAFEDDNGQPYLYLYDVMAVFTDEEELPTIQPVIVPCDYAKACNEATMDKLTSAVAYYDVLEELRKHGYVLVDLREVNNESN